MTITTADEDKSPLAMVTSEASPRTKDSHQRLDHSRAVVDAHRWAPGTSRRK